MTSKFARRATLATGHPSAEGVLDEPRRGPVGCLERLLVTAQESFVLGVRTSPRARLWILAYQTLTLPLSLWRYVHDFRATVEGTEIRVLCVGRRKRFRNLLDGLFCAVEQNGPDVRNGAVERIGGKTPRWAWRPRSLRVHGASLVVVDIHPWLATNYRREGWLIVPENVRWQGDLSGLPPLRPPKALRSDMNKVARYGYRLEEAEGGADWAEFIDEMVLPYARARYGSRAWSPGRRMLRSLQRHGRLFFVTRGDVRAAGGCFVSTPSDLWFLLLGTRNGDERWVREGALTALYLLSFDWAKRKGYRRFDAGRTRPFPNDGVARYKAKIGLAPVPTPLAFTNALYLDPECASLAEQLRAEPLFCLEDGSIEVFPPGVGEQEGCGAPRRGVEP